MRIFIHFITSSFFLIFLASSVKARDVWRVSFAQLVQMAESPQKGILIDLIKAMALEAGVDTDFRVVPFTRSMHNLATGKVDMHIPLLEPETGADKLPGRLSAFRIFQVEFSTFSRKPIDLNNTQKLSIETEATHTSLFKLPLTPSFCIPCSVRKIYLKRLDAFIFATRPVQDIIDREKLSGIIHQVYRIFPVKVVFAKNLPRAFREKVRLGLYRIIKNGSYARILGEHADRQLIEKVKREGLAGLDAEGD